MFYCALGNAICDKVLMCSIQTSNRTYHIAALSGLDRTEWVDAIKFKMVKCFLRCHPIPP